MAIFEKETRSIGELVLFLDYRPDACRHGLHERKLAELSLPLGAFSVGPERVYYWDRPLPSGDPRINNIKRFSHMLSLRAHATRVEGANDVDELEALITASDLPAMATGGPLVPPPNGWIARAVSRYMASDDSPGHHRADTAGVIFRFKPPDGVDLAILRARVRESGDLFDESHCA